ncbi:MAG: SpoIIE family protein phosphatase [Sphaerochaetaceae bacterium]|nr:SpoIIE family protein phosphatase [Sphaerochaetaceae bacterium]MDC7238507.1 SpoIIE family protein phosphatase [Sphaerochaetaceae bacterium]MDC7250672.1 SpoIIE family protein phosphatase [Sphaerochaetaceae bacterium]
MKDIFIDIDYSQIYKFGQKIGGDVFLQKRNPERNQIVAVLSDGLGSGVKANVLASLTANMAKKLSFSPMDLKHSANIIMDTLPVCKERKISYSTFSIADIRYNALNSNIRVNFLEYDNPHALFFRDSTNIDWEGDVTILDREKAFKKEEIVHNVFNLRVGDRIIIISDGVTQAGLGASRSLGWRLNGVKQYISDILKDSPSISSRALTKQIVNKALSLDGLASKDDITCCCIYIRKPRRTLIVTGPPFLKESDDLLCQKIKDFKGKKIISGGTTALIVSKHLNKKIKVDLSTWSKDVPPSSTMDGMDLVTEGMLTLSKVVYTLEKKIPLVELANDAVKKYIELILDSDQVHFLVGTKINEAHQDPSIPVEIGIRRTLIERLRKTLEENYLKETSIEYI